VAAGVGVNWTGSLAWNQLLEEFGIRVLTQYLGLSAITLHLRCAVTASAGWWKPVTWKANFLCNLGYGDRSKLFPRNRHLEFEEACRVLW